MKVVYIAEDGTQFDNEKDCVAYENTPVIYCVKNTVNEYDERITRFCSTLENAKKELRDCSDWCDRVGTGRIYRFRLDSHMEPKYELVMEVNGSML